MHLRYVVQRFRSSKGTKTVLTRWEFDDVDDAKRLMHDENVREDNPKVKYEVITEQRE